MPQTVFDLFSVRINKDELSARLNANPAEYAEAVTIATSAAAPQGWRAAWILGHSSSKYDPRLQPHASALIAAIPGKKDGHQRELLRLLEKLMLDDEQEGRLFDIAMTLWESIGKPPALRIFAFRFLAKVVTKYPELYNEIAFLTQPMYAETLSPGIRKGFERTLAELQQRI